MGNWPSYLDSLEVGCNVMQGDATDSDFWERVKAGRAESKGKMRLVLLAMPKHSANLYAARQLFDAGYTGRGSAIAQFDDQVEALKEVGVHAAFNFYAEAAAGFAEHVIERLGPG